jgi:hypothetical protein
MSAFDLIFAINEHQFHEGSKIATNRNIYIVQWIIPFYSHFEDTAVSFAWSLG